MSFIVCGLFMSVVCAIVPNFDFIKTGLVNRENLHMFSFFQQTNGPMRLDWTEFLGFHKNPTCFQRFLRPWWSQHGVCK
jgi:hypothetical protein